MKTIFVAIITALLCSLAVAKPIGKVFTVNGGLVILHDTQETCPNLMKFGEYIFPTGRRITACWIVHDNHIDIVDEDGDEGVINPADIVDMSTQRKNKVGKNNDL